MSLQEVINNDLSKWMLAPGPDSDVVISSRVRLARNIDGIPFPNRASSDQSKQVFETMKKSLKDDSDFKLKMVHLKEITEVEKKVLKEKYLISPQHAQRDDNAGVAFSDDEVISIMVNEEDHIRAQVLYPGLQVKEAYQVIDKLDNSLESKMNFAYSEKYGYLTACPTNVGTGMRASVMVHLPGLNLTKRIQSMLHGVSKLGLAVRGVFGEGTEAQGNIYQISNQVTLGRSEEEIIDNLNHVTKQIIEHERQWRKKLMEDNETRLKDRVLRSYGILRYAYKISSEEAVRLLSDVKLGVDLGIITNVDSTVFTELLILSRSGFLQKIEKKNLSTNERDIKRARLIGKRLSMDKK